VSGAAWWDLGGLMKQEFAGGREKTTICRDQYRCITKISVECICVLHKTGAALIAREPRPRSSQSPIPQHPSDEFGASSDQVGIRIPDVNYGELLPSPRH
jgi:hypothetical protein